MTDATAAAAADIAELLEPDAPAADQNRLAAAIARLGAEDEDAVLFRTLLPPITAALALPPSNAQATAGALIAAACRDAAARTAASDDTQLIPALAAALARAGHTPASAVPLAVQDAARVQLLRAAGNLCFDHEANRVALREAGGAMALGLALSAVTQSDEEEVTADGGSRAAHLAGAGAALNVAAGDDELKKELVEQGAIESLLWLLHEARTDIEQHYALAALARFTALDEAVARMGPALPTLVDALAAADGEADEAAEVTELLRAVVRSDAAVAHLASMDLLARLASLAEEHDRPFVRQQAAVLLTVALGDDACQQLLWTPAAGADAPMVRCLLSWIRHADPEMQVAGAVGLGNLCRTDAAAAVLGAAEGLITDLLAMLEAKLSFVQHAALGALKNLCRLPANRPFFLTSDALRQLGHVLNDPQAPLQYAACSILRTLCSGGGAGDEAGFAALLERMTGTGSASDGDTDAMDEDGDTATPEAEADGAKSFLPRLVHLSKSEVLAARAEAMRALAATVRAAPMADRLWPLAEAGGADALVRMLGEKHPLLQQEATVALVILAACGGSCADAIVRAGGLEVLAEHLELEVGPHHKPEALCNELSFAQQLLTATTGGDTAGDGTAQEVVTAGAGEGSGDAGSAAARGGPEVRERIRARVRALAGDAAPAPIVQQHATTVATALGL